MNEFAQFDWIDDILDEPDDEDDGLIYEDMYYETIEEESSGDCTWVNPYNSTHLPQFVLEYGRTDVNTFGDTITTTVLSMDHLVLINKHWKIHSTIQHNEHPH